MAKYLNADLIFKNRTQAGETLAEKLVEYKLENPFIIALPRGGVPVAKPIAERLNAKLDIIVSKKIGAPNNPELAIGAVTSHGDYIISPYYDMELRDKKWDYLQKQIVYMINDCREKEQKYISCKGVPVGRPKYENANIIIVDDGTATGMTALAAIKSIKKQNPKSITLAIPVISNEAYEEIEEMIDKIETLKIPKEFIAVGVHYQDFHSVSDEEIRDVITRKY